MRYISYTLQWAHLRLNCTIQWILAYSRVTNITTINFRTFQKGILDPLSSHSPSPLPPPLAVTKLLSASTDLPVLDIAYTWNQYEVICDWLLSLSVMFSTLAHVVECICISPMTKDAEHLFIAYKLFRDKSLSRKW